MTPQGLLQRRLKAEGRCVTCCQPHDSGLSRCRRCQDKANAHTREQRRKARYHRNKPPKMQPEACQNLDKA